MNSYQDTVSCHIKRSSKWSQIFFLSGCDARPCLNKKAYVVKLFIRASLGLVPDQLLSRCTPQWSHQWLWHWWENSSPFVFAQTGWLHPAKIWKNTCKDKICIRLLFYWYGFVMLCSLHLHALHLFEVHRIYLLIKSNSRHEQHGWNWRLRGIPIPRLSFRSATPVRKVCI